METLLTVILVGVLSGVVAKVLITGLDIYSLVANRNRAFHSARMAMDRMVDEILLVEASEITELDDDLFGFRDRNGDLTNFRKTTVSLGGVSVPCIFRGDDLLASKVEFLAFNYFEEDGTPTSLPSLVKRIYVDLILEASGGGGQVHLRTNIVPRNFMYTGFE